MTLIVAAVGKISQGSTAFELQTFPAFIPPALSQVLWDALPGIELGVGVLLVIGLLSRYAAIGATMLIIGFITSNILLISNGVQKCASCFGAAGSFTPGASLVLDGIMLVLVSVILFGNKKEKEGVICQTTSLASQ